MHTLGATCDTPVSIMASVTESGVITAEARFWEPENPTPFIATAENENPVELAAALVTALKS